MNESAIGSSARTARTGLRRYRAAGQLGLAGLLLAAAALPAAAAPPAQPLVLSTIPEPGKTGGELRMLIGGPRDTRLLTVYGHARLVNYDADLNFFPDILADYKVEEGRQFTFTLREGHRWSDGQPFTTDDFRFWWEDIAQNAKLSPTGVPVLMTVDGSPPTVEILSPTEIRYSWPLPNPYFLPALAGPTPEFIYAPAHYLKQFHEKYADAAALAAMVTETSSRDWAQLFGRKERMNRFDNPDLPTLEPWQLVTRPPAERFVAERNPNFHRVDANGVQLPYIDKVVLEVVDSKLIPVKTGAGETDLQSRGLFFKDYTFLKKSQERSGLVTRLWPEARGAHLALYPNLNAADPVWRTLFRDQRFREALALGIDRDALSQTLYFGLATPANNTVIEGSPLWTPEIGAPCTAYDAARANALLDELGLTERTGDGLRKLPDGRPLELIVETAGEDTEQIDMLELVRNDWLELGLRIHAKPSEREVFRNRVFSGESLMTVWFGIENGVPTPDMSPQEFAPTNQFEQLQWPKWGQWHETKGQAGEAPELPAAKHLAELNTRWAGSATTEERAAIWQEMLSIYSRECFTIGTIANVQQPIAVRKGLRNVPENGIYNWMPTAQLGFYRPDSFWFER